jgi:hypothetical protein
MTQKINAVVMPPLREEDALGITLNVGDNIHKRFIRKRCGVWVVWTPKSKSGRYVWLESFTSEELMLTLKSKKKREC